MTWIKVHTKKIDELKCFLTTIAHKYASFLLWGLDCDIERIKNDFVETYNSIKLLESATDCKIDSKTYHNIEICYNRIRDEYLIASLCNNC